MTSRGYKFGHHKIVGNPPVDWSHAGAYLIGLYNARVDEDPLGSDLDAQYEFRRHITEAHGIDDLSEEDRALAEELAAADGVDIANFPGGDNYRASLVSSTNPLGLPGDLWALTSDASEGALVAALMRLTDEGELEIKGPNGRDWLPLTDLTVISDLNIIGVTPEAVQLFKNYDRDNTLGVIGSYPLSDKGPFPTKAQLVIPMPKEIPEPRTEDDKYWENSGESFGNRPVTAAVIVNSADDLEDAIAAAAHDPDLRWYVERRVAALGLEADLPWQRR